IGRRTDRSGVAPGSGQQLGACHEACRCSQACGESAAAANPMKCRNAGRRPAWYAWLIALCLAFAIPSSAEVLKITVNDTIHPITDEYIGRAIAEAERNHDQALLIEMNTPGGLLESTREIIEKIVASKVPVIIYV